MPRSSYEELAKILRAYHAAGSDAALEDVAKRAAMNKTIVSGNNKFLVGAGLLEGGRKKTLTDLGVAVAKALDYEMPDEIRARWGEVVASNEFFSQLLSAVRIRGGMEASALRAHVAYTAGESKKPAVMTGAGAVVDILRAAGVVEEADGRYVVRNFKLRSPDVETPRPPSDEVGGGHEAPQQAVATVSSVPVQSVTSVGGTRVSINIEVRVDCKPDELEGVGDQLQALVHKLNRQPEE